MGPLLTHSTTRYIPVTISLMVVASLRDLVPTILSAMTADEMPRPHMGTAHALRLGLSETLSCGMPHIE